MLGIIDSKIEARSTVNHPANSVVVIGFECRDVRLGQDVLVLKENAITRGNGLDGEAVVIPSSQYESLGKDTGHLLLLNGDEVLSMEGETARENSALNTFDYENERITLNYLPLDSSGFESYNRDEIDITS
jgi:hypothetical protein